jgi:hypothetical protein
VPLFNASFFFRRIGLIEDAFEVDFMSGLSLIGTKRYVQACEMLRRL